MKRIAANSFLAFSAVLLITGTSAFAAANTCTWSGGGGTPNWSDAGNWDTKPVSGNGDTIIFPVTGVQQATCTNDLAINVATIQFTGGAYTVTVTGQISTSGTLTVSGGTHIMTGAGGIRLNNNIVFDVSAAAQLTVGTVISNNNPSGRNIDKQGAGTLILSGANTYAGNNATLTLINGVLGIGNDSAIPNPSTTPFIGLIVQAGTIQAVGGTHSITTNVQMQSGLTVAGTNDLTISGIIDLNAAVRTFTVSNTGITTFSGVISSLTGGISKGGAGTLTLSGNNTYGAGTTVTAGELDVNSGTGSGTGAGAVSVSGGILGGNGAGTIAGTITTSGTGVVRPGTAAAKGILKAAAANLGAGGGLSIRVSGNTTPGTDFDRLALTAGLTGGGTLALDLAGLPIGNKTVTGIATYTALTGGVFATVNYTNNPLGFVATQANAGTSLNLTLDSPPSVTSINRTNPSPTGAATVNFTVVFDKAVTGVDSSDFALAVTGTSGTIGVPTSGDGGITWNVPITTVAGNGTLGLNLVDDDTIKDAGSKPLGGAGVANGNFTGQVYAIDTTFPTVTSINRANASPTNAGTINFTVVFSEAVTGVGATDFALALTGASTGSVGAPTTADNITYNVPVTTTGGDGTIGLNLVDDDTIIDSASNPLGGTGAGNGNFTGQVYSIDKTPPTVTSIVKADADPTNAATINFTVTFSEAVSGVDAADFALALTGGATGTINAPTTADNIAYNVSVTTGAGSGTIGLNLNDNDSITDSSTNPLGGAGAGNGNLTGQIYTIDKTPPTVSSVNRVNPDPTNAASVDFTVTFSENVSGVDSTDFALTTTGVATPSITGVATVTASTYTVTVNTGTGNGTIRLDVLNDNSIIDSVGNPLGAAFATGQVYTVDKLPATVTSVSSTNANGSYKAGATIVITITFDKVVTVTGTPQLALNNGGTANFASGSGTATLNFNYVVGAGQDIADLDYNATNSLTLNSGTIKDSATNNATLTLPAPAAAGSLGANKNIVIDTIAPVVNSVTSTTANGSYKAGVTIGITITFNEVVVVTGTPQLALNSGGTANFFSGSNSTVLTFNYVVGAGQTSADLDYAAINSLTLNGGTITDVATNPATLTLPAVGGANSIGGSKNIIIDTTAPTVTNVTSTTADGSYVTGALIVITIDFTEPVNVTGTPLLALNSGGTASFFNGSGSSTLVFHYTVGAGENSADLDYSATTSLTLNGGTINDAATNAATLTLAAPGAATSLGFNKNIVIDTAGPVVTNVTSTTADGSYNAGNTIVITITFNEAATVTGTPLLALNSGGSASFVSGSGTTVLTFNYTVAAGQNSADLDYVATTSLTLNGGTIKDALGNDAPRTLANPGAAGSLGANKNIVIDTTAPTVSSVSSTTANGSYKAGATIAITVTFNEIVNVTGTPQLTLNDGGTANFTSGSGTTILTFNYVVSAGENTPDLDYAATTSLALNGGTIKDVATNAAVLTLATPGNPGSLGNSKNIVIDTVAPTVTSVSATTADGAYNAGNVIAITVTFSEPINVTGTPTLTLNSGGTASFNSVAGNVATFNYTVAAGQNSADLDYTATTALALSGGTIRDPASNDAVLTLATPGAANSLGANKNIVIDTIAPTITTVTSTAANGSYKAGAVIPITITFSEPVVVTGTPLLALNSGGSASFTSGSGTNTLTFTYTVAGGQTSADLDYTATNSLTIVGASIKDPASNNATLTLPAVGGANSIGGSKNIVIDTTPPTVTSITTTPPTTTNAATVTFTVTFSEAVSGVDASDFSIVGTSAGSSFNSIAGGPTVYTVTINTGGSGTLGLNITDDDTIIDVATNPLGGPGAGNGNFTGQTYTIDKTPPTVVSVTTSTANGLYGAPSTVAIQVNFSEAVNIVSGTPQLGLNTGAGTTLVNITGGSGTATLTGTYTIASGDFSTDLDYAATNSLTGNISDLVGNAGVLTLPAVGSASSLAGGAAIQVDAANPTFAVAPVNQIIAEDSGAFAVTFNVADNIGGFAGVTVVSATSNNTTLIANPTIVAGATLTRTLNFVAPPANSNGVATITVTIRDNSPGLLTAVATFTVTVTPVNDNPVISLPNNGTALAYTEGGAATAIDGGATATDVDSNAAITQNTSTGQSFPGTLTVTLDNGESFDVLSINNQGTGGGQVGSVGGALTFGGASIGTFTTSFTGSATFLDTTPATSTVGNTTTTYSPGQTTLTVNFNFGGAFTAANAYAAAAAVMQNVTYSSTSERPATNTRTATFQLLDGAGGPSNTSARQIAVTEVNDTPVVTVNIGTAGIPGTPGNPNMAFNDQTVTGFSPTNGDGATVTTIDQIPKVVLPSTGGQVSPVTFTAKATDADDALTFTWSFTNTATNAVSTFSGTGAFALGIVTGFSTTTPPATPNTLGNTFSISNTAVVEFSVPGIYTVSVQVSDGRPAPLTATGNVGTATYTHGASGTEVESTSTLRVNTPPRVDPNGDLITLNTFVPSQDAPITFTLSTVTTTPPGTVDQDGHSLTYTVDFGDGDIEVFPGNSAIFSSSGNTITFTHTYTTLPPNITPGVDGSVEIPVTVTITDGQTGADLGTVTVDKLVVFANPIIGAADTVDAFNPDAPAFLGLHSSSQKGGGVRFTAVGCSTKGVPTVFVYGIGKTPQKITQVTKVASDKEEVVRFNAGTLVEAPSDMYTFGVDFGRRNGGQAGVFVVEVTDADGFKVRKLYAVTQQVINGTDPATQDVNVAASFITGKMHFDPTKDDLVTFRGRFSFVSTVAKQAVPDAASFDLTKFEFLAPSAKAPKKLSFVIGVGNLLVQAEATGTRGKVLGVFDSTGKKLSSGEKSSFQFKLPKSTTPKYSVNELPNSKPKTFEALPITNNPNTPFGAPIKDFQAVLDLKISLKDASGSGLDTEGVSKTTGNIATTESKVFNPIDNLLNAAHEALNSKELKSLNLQTADEPREDSRVTISAGTNGKATFHQNFRDLKAGTLRPLGIQVVLFIDNGVSQVVFASKIPTGFLVRNGFGQLAGKK